MTDAALFISDLHLSPERPLPVHLFYRFIEEVAPRASALYVLGDFLEAWVGDDTLSHPFHHDLATALKVLSDRGVALFFLPGNRDFLVGPAFAAAAGLTLLADPARIDLFGTATLLTHGDQFCTDDAEYQDFRRQVRDPAWQQQFLRQPLQQRLALAKALRESSEHAKASKRPEIMDVNSVAISDMLKIPIGCAPPIRRIIHGHTHRPARHEHLIDGQRVERWVLPDWYEQGGYLACDADGCRLSDFV
jgi:UDP-2,3-diacylglucosamine hydrolase